MIDMFTTGTAVLLQMQFLRHRFSVLGCRIIFSLTLGALKGNDIAHDYPFYDLSVFLYL